MHIQFQIFGYLIFIFLLSCIFGSSGRQPGPV